MKDFVLAIAVHTRDRGKMIPGRVDIEHTERDQPMIAPPDRFRVDLFQPNS